jgi:hypothetical protein
MSMVKESAVGVIERRKGHGWIKRRLPESWPARVILEEDRTRYLMERVSVSSGAKCERRWNPKRHANATLVVEREELQRTNLRGKSDLEDADISILEPQRHGHRYGTLESHGFSQETAGTLLAEHGDTREIHRILLVVKRN